MLEELARLAQLSPHLLRDIGFTPGPGSSTPAREVWRKEQLCIAVVRHDTGLEVQVEGLTVLIEDNAPDMERFISEVSACPGGWNHSRVMQHDFGGAK